MQGLSEQIKNFAASIGFSACGIGSSGPLPDATRALEKYLQENRNGTMQYLEKNRKKRDDPKQIMPEARSIISVTLNYYPEEVIPENGRFVIAKYAYGKDYHDVMKEKLHILADFLKTELGARNNRVFVDSGPVFEKARAGRAGLGWMGKNTILIHPIHGSFFFIGEILSDLEAEPDQPIPDHCGTCSKCSEACPTGALDKPYELDATKCLSYWTIEHRGPVPDTIKANLRDRIYGCDICQDVCPFNRNSIPSSIREFHPPEELKSFSKKEWVNLSEVQFEFLFKGSAIHRTGYKKLMQNIHDASSSL
jgi:epoxyqueuosine reductase